MIFSTISINSEEPIYAQIVNQVKAMIDNGMLAANSKLPSTRELAEILKVSRNSCIRAYEILEDNNYIKIVKGKGTFVLYTESKGSSRWEIDWPARNSNLARDSVNLDIVKSEPVTRKGMISFKSISPDENLFNLEHIKRHLVNSLSFDGEKLFNYGYAKGYKPLTDFLFTYMTNKGINGKNKEILITNGFTEGFDILLSALTEVDDYVICENPTHNTAIKLMKLHNLNLLGIDLDEDGINVEKLEGALKEKQVKLVYLIPSYHNPTGTTMSAEKRKKVYELCKTYGVPIIEDGFNEELLYSSSHIAPITSLANEDNGVIYIGSFSKILFPGIRIGWIAADKELIDILISLKRSKNIHTSVLDQAFLNQYLRSGDFDLYVKKIRKIYRSKYNFIVQCVKKYLPPCKIYGDGGLHIFLEFENLLARRLLEASMKKDVIFMPGDVFYVDDRGSNTLRLGFSRLSLTDIEKGLMVIGECAYELLKHRT
jgi:DNA-binding transcriptional MocR family regulator